jgi:DNA-binding MarR family transcriptional regulator/GNAT superfamily N-acetyltransferase
MNSSDIARIRRFARAVTTEVGALDTSFLGRGRPLGVARVLNAIGHGRIDVAKIRDGLKLDSGLMSRMLRGLEEEGLVVTGPDPKDKRRRIAELTEAGLAEFNAYEALSNARATQLLARHTDNSALLAAMDVIALALGRDDIELRVTDPGNAAARHCLGEYYGELARRFERGFDVTLSKDPDAASMIAPKGTFLVAFCDDLPVGCVALKGTDLGYGEIKRLWVAPSARGLGLGRRLMDEAETHARRLGMDVLRLDTNKALPEAIAMYRNGGWVEIDRYNDDPYPDYFFEKRL